MISIESQMILMRVENQETTINNKVRAIEQVIVFDHKTKDKASNISLIKHLC